MNEKVECADCKFFNSETNYCKRSEGTVRPCYGCYEGENRIMTNGDKIRQMTDEELAELLDMKDDCTCIEDYCPAYTDCRRNKDWRHTTCQQTILDWLKQEAKDE